MLKRYIALTSLLGIALMVGCAGPAKNEGTLIVPKRTSYFEALNEPGSGYLTLEQAKIKQSQVEVTIKRTVNRHAFNGIFGMDLIVDGKVSNTEAIGLTVANEKMHRATHSFQTVVMSCDQVISIVNAEEALAKVKWRNGFLDYRITGSDAFEVFQQVAKQCEKVRTGRYR